MFAAPGSDCSNGNTIGGGGCLSTKVTIFGLREGEGAERGEGGRENV